MTEKRFAVTIGVDSPDTLRYASADAQAIADVLRGTFELTAFLGAEAEGDAGAIERTLESVRERADESDLLLVYFAGHTEFLRMSFLQRILGEFPGTALLILDCCLLDFDLISGDAQFGIVVASASSAATREDDDLRHGVLTHHLLQALSGAAAGNDGRVTFQTMADYLLEQVEPRPGVVMTARGGSTVLIGPRPAPAEVQIVPLEGPLDRHAAALTALIDRLARQAPAPAGGTSKVDRLKLATGAESVALLEYRAGSSHFYQVLATARFDLGEVRHLLGSRAGLHFPTDPLWFGHVARSGGHTLFCMPVDRPEGTTLLLALVDPAEELIAIGEPLAKILETVWHTDVPASPHEAEIHVLTALRLTFGRLPTALYERCLQLYREVLESFVIVFEPVVRISPDPAKVGVHSYEALARRSSADNRAPIAMLKVAHTWGDRFMVERDRVIVRKALTSYAKAHAAGPWATDFLRPVSVNVAVRSLLSDAYIDAVREAVVAAGLDPANVTLEISEQDPIEERSGERWPGEPHAYFHQRLVALARDVGVSFAVDDFGVGYATVSRMAELPLTQIKVDRAMLHHPQAAAELDLVMRVARDPVEQGTAHIGRVVIVEGVDDESPLTLQDLYDQRIRHVQGYIARTPASPQLQALSDEVREDIAARVRGDERPSGVTGRNSAANDEALRRGA